MGIPALPKIVLLKTFFLLHSLVDITLSLLVPHFFFFNFSGTPRMYSTAAQH